MTVYRVSSRIMQSAGTARKRRHIRWWIYAILQRVVTASIVAIVATVLFKVGLSSLFFLLLPVGMSLVISRGQLSRLLHGTFLYAVLTIFLTILYYGCVAAIEIFIHTPGFGLLSGYHGQPVSVYIVVTTTFAWAIILAPPYNWLQEMIDRRFNLRDFEARRAVEAFTSALREEIDLDKICDGLLAVVQQTMQPISTSIWVSTTAQGDAHEKPGPVEGGLYKTLPFAITIAAGDALRAFALSHSGSIEVVRLQLDSPVVRIMQANDVELALPLISQGELIGMLTLGPRLDGQKYARAERSLLESLAAQVAPALRVAQLAQEQQTQVAEHERIEQELRTAQQIQHTFLPKEIPAPPGWQLVPFYQSAREVGGDFYDFLPFADGRLGIVIGDVTDKGVPAALVMTATRTMLRTAAHEQTSPAEVLARVNDLLFNDIPPSMFVTCFYVLLDPASGRMRFANAGHEPPFRQASGSAVELWATGMPLGMMPGTEYEEYETVIEPGESLLFYSDGLVEAHNERREMFGFARLQSLLADQGDGAHLVDPLLEELQRFTGDGWEQEDDVTLLALHRAIVREAPAMVNLQEAEASG